MSNLKIFTNNIEDAALNQINKLMEQEAFKGSKVRIMPDVHAGAGCVIGFTGDLGDKIIPNIVGVDIGCGMITMYLGNIEINYEELDKVIKERVPCGFKVHEKEDKIICIKALLVYDELKDVSRILKSVGTLGGGNHFIEIDEDKKGGKYLIIHTGSRNLGLQVAKMYQKKAINMLSKPLETERTKLINRLKSENRSGSINNELKKLKKKVVVPNDLAYLEGDLAKEYLHDMKIAQNYAKSNRSQIAYNIMKGMNWDWSNDDFYAFQTIHNYIGEDNIIRKGAISARKGEKVLIPISMSSGCILGVGKGNEDWNYSAPHGAGRLLSRTKAREILSVEDFQEDMKGIYTTTANANTIDESPRAYKNLKEIVNSIKDTVDIVEILKPVYNFKAE